MSETKSRIWKPNVEPTENPVPFPSVSPSNSMNQRKLFTKTSLIAINKEDHQSTSYNRAVLRASQSYNNSPKPFRRQEQIGASVDDSPSISFTNHQSNWAQQQQQQQHQLQQQQHQNQHQNHLDIEKRKKEFGFSTERIDKVGHQVGGSNRRTRAESMSPKLVHKQYNSPLDLYSMNNIRKTIEAHTELIAPGVKGINFMKYDTPINKQSEVFRLVKEEEGQRTQQTTPRLSPISGQPLKLPTAMQTNNQQTLVNQEQIRSSKQQQIATTNTSECSWANRQQSHEFIGSSKPVCCECGHSIVGPFAKIKNRSVHPQCFNCTTCGTSLKNTGYFTIEEKLYCEIHAKQVANMMRIPFNFAPASRELTTTTKTTTTLSGQNTSSLDQSRLEHSEARRCQPEVAINGAQTLGLNRQADTGTSYKPPVSLGTPATISTMFSNRSQSQDCANRREQKYTSSASIVDEMNNSQSQQQTAQVSNGNDLARMGSMNHRQYTGQQSMVSSDTIQDRQFIQESCQIGIGGRLPVCVNCHAQIHGPYILASQTTWCKHCSQNHFNCSSCNRSLLDIGFVEDGSNRHYCEHCYEAYCAPTCSKCNIKIKGDCLNALNKKWHPSCFTCGHCRRPFGNSSFYLEDNVPYCERDWRALFTTKCYACSYPIEAGDKWIEALDRNYHSNCFRCTSCQAKLEGSTFYRKGDKPFCRLHAR